MKFIETEIHGVRRILLDEQKDERGFLARSFCAREFQENGIEDEFVQANVSFNARYGTLRGMHYAAPPARESKLVRCVRGMIWDVVMDNRVESPTLGAWIAAELTADNREAIYVPPAVAHGFLTLADDTEVHYLMGSFYDPEAARGIRWDDSFFGVKWPFEPLIISERDRGYAVFCP